MDNNRDKTKRLQGNVGELNEAIRYIADDVVQKVGESYWTTKQDEGFVRTGALIGIRIAYEIMIGVKAHDRYDNLTDFEKLLIDMMDRR